MYKAQTFSKTQKHCLEILQEHHLLEII